MRLMRVRRIVEYLGTPEAVQAQLDSSLKEGRHNLLRDMVAITIAQLGPPEFVEGETMTKEAASSGVVVEKRQDKLPPTDTWQWTMVMSTSDYDFVTDRLAIGNVASRATPGFCAVVSILATQPWDEVTGAPEVPDGREVSAIEISTGYNSTCVLHIDIADGETKRVCPDNGETYGNDLDSFLDDATSFIAAHIRRGCVLVHCGAGKSRSVAVVIAYLCRYAGMSLTEALAFVSARRPGACPAPCFIEAIKRWLRLDELAEKGPRKAGLRRLTEYTQEIGGYDAEDAPSTDAPSVNDQYTNEAIAQGR